MFVSWFWMVAEDIDGSKTNTLGPKLGWPGGGGAPVVVVVGPVPPTGTRLNDWAVVPLQVNCCNCTLSAVDAPGVSRHRLLLRLVNV